MKTRSFVVVCAATAMLAAGCATDPKPSASTSSAKSATTETSKLTLNEEDQAAADADAAYREWQRVRRSCLADPASTVSSCFDEVAIGTQLSSDYSSLEMSQQDGTHVEGDIKIVSLELVSVDLTDRVDRPADPDQGIPEVRIVPTVVFDVCIDRGEYDLVDAAGESHLPADYSRFRRTTAEVANYGYPDRTQWRVRNGYKDAVAVESCES